MKVREIITQCVYYLVLVLLVIFFLFPFLFMISKSFMSDYDLIASPPLLFPQEFTIRNYFNLFDSEMIGWLGNTLYVFCFNAFFVTFSSSLSAFAFTKLDFKIKKIVFPVMMSTVMIPGIVTSIPLYVLYNNMNWRNTLFFFFFPSIFGGGAMTVFLFMQFMRGISREIDNAAKIDGAGPFRRYLQICMPLCKSIIIFQVVSVFNGVWNDYMGPIMYLDERSKYTLGLGIYYRFLQQTDLGFGANDGAKMAAGVVFSIPAAIVFFVFQKRLVDGIMIGGIKG